jgi:HD-GYP domain-containing protein (c-di-GMP phosphodiesterase class II)
MHPIIGRSILQPVGFLEPIIPVVLYHHERWDGKGFPEGRAGKQIPETARMVAIADVFDRLRYTDGMGLPGLSVREALERITMEAGSRFDPELVRVFRKVVLAHSAGAPDAAEVHDPAPPEVPEL